LGGWWLELVFVFVFPFLELPFLEDQNKKKFSFGSTRTNQKSPKKKKHQPHNKKKNQITSKNKTNLSGEVLFSSCCTNKWTKPWSCHQKPHTHSEKERRRRRKISTILLFFGQQRPYSVQTCFTAAQGSSGCLNHRGR